MLFFVGRVVLTVLVPAYAQLLLVPVLVLGFLGNRHGFATITRARRPATMRASATTLTADDTVWPLSDIATLAIADDMGELSTTTCNVRTGEGGTRSTAGDAVWNRQAYRSLFLVLRPRGTGATNILAGGLAVDCARALLEHLRAAIAAHGGRRAHPPNVRPHAPRAAGPVPRRRRARAPLALPSAFARRYP
ncbi:MAG: hypothetical protein RLW62_24945 [Gammaproteobacteria bacterium]